MTCSRRRARCAAGGRVRARHGCAAGSCWRPRPRRSACSSACRPRRPAHGGVLIESTEPVAYAVSRPDPLTVLVDLRNVSVADAANQVARSGPIAGVTLEQATADRRAGASRACASRCASPSSYAVRSARNMIRLELGARAATPARAEGTPAAASQRRWRHRRRPAPAPLPRATSTATIIEKVRADHTRTATTITLERQRPADAGRR